MSGTVLESLRYQQDYLFPGPVCAALSATDQRWPLARTQRLPAGLRQPARLEWVQEGVPEHHRDVSTSKEVDMQTHHIVDWEDSGATPDLSSPPVLVFPVHDLDYISFVECQLVGLGGFK